MKGGRWADQKTSLGPGENSFRQFQARLWTPNRHLNFLHKLANFPVSGEFGQWPMLATGKRKEEREYSVSL